MDLAKIAKIALISLQETMQTAFVLYKEGHQTLPAELIHMAEASLALLDLYLTGLSGGNNRRKGELGSLFQGETAHIHLSDGGYSRLTLDLFNEECSIWIDRGLSLPKALARWDALRA